MIRSVIFFLIVVLFVILGSLVSSRLWSGKPEQLSNDFEVVIDENMTIAEFGKANELDRKSLKNIFGLNSPDDLKKQVSDIGLSAEQLNKKVNQSRAIQAEHATKNWLKIFLKGGLWILFLSTVFILLRNGKVTARTRKVVYVTAIVLFGVFLGSDPSPMGTIKDAIVLLGSKGVIFPPRLIAFFIFLLMVIVANKFICSWGCQLGTLQDFIFRLNRNSTNKKALFGQIKVPFIISNIIRVFFFIILTVSAFLWATDIVERIDPFKIFKPQVISALGGIFIAVILISSLFIYRPWCHFLCPFGLVGWLAEKISFFKIKVDYDKCIACEACSKACPSNVMEAILKQDHIVPDCFSCGTCIETCPENAISFDKGKRQSVPEDKFK